MAPASLLGKDKMATKDDIREILQSELGLDTSSLADDDGIFSTGLLDSLSSLRLLMGIEQKYGISISPLDVSLDDMDTVNSIAQTVEFIQQR